MADYEHMRDRLVSLVLGELSERQRAEVRAHALECDQCRAELRQLEETLARAARRKDLSVDDLTYQSGEDALYAAMGREEKPNATARPRTWRVFEWRRIMTSPTAKLSVAAVIALAVLLGLHLGGPFGSAVTWADVREAFLAQPWVHLKYDNGAETWYNLQTGDHYFKDWDGRCVSVDRALNIRQSYHSVWGEHISENRPVVYKDGVIPAWEPKTAWEATIGHWERMAENGGTGHWQVERSVENVEGKQLVRFDRYYNDAVGRRLLIKQIWADPQTRLPVMVWERLSLADREEQKREFITGEFDFPDRGPATIHDLGVPRGLPVVRSFDKTPEPSVVEVLEAGRAALERFPSRYRAVRWDNDRESEVEVVWRDGEKIHHNHYFNLSARRHPEYHLDLPAGVQAVLEWTKTQPPISIYMFDGERQYNRRHHPVFDDLREPQARVMRTKTGSLPSSSKPLDNQWAYASRNPGGFEPIDDAPEELGACIGLRRDAGDIRRDFYIDPKHDYICVRWIWWKQRSGRWEKEREYECSGFTRLPQGQWYATKQVLITYPDPERGTARGGANWNIDVTVLGEDAFPPDTFDGEKLLEGAKIETY